MAAWPAASYLAATAQHSTSGGAPLLPSSRQGRLVSLQQIGVEERFVSTYPSPCSSPCLIAIPTNAQPQSPLTATANSLLPFFPSNF